MKKYRDFSLRFINFIKKIKEKNLNSGEWCLQTMKNQANIDFGYWAGSIDLNWCYLLI